MTVDDDADAAKLHELGRDLPALDVDGTTAEQIARRARADVGKPRSLRRLALPLVAAVIVLGYAVWAILKLIEVLR